MQIVANSWGPALLVCLTVLIGMVYNNARLTDLKDALNKRIDSLESRLGRIEDRLFKVEDRLTKVEERLARLESPIKLH